MFLICAAFIVLIAASGLLGFRYLNPSHVQSHGAIAASDSNSVDAPGPISFPQPPAPQSVANYYVATSGSDANDGSLSAPWATIQHAADAVAQGSVVHVAPGNYGAVTSQTSGTADARIRFISDVQWGATLQAAGPTVWNNSGSYVDIMGFEITGNAAVGILNDGSFVHIVGNNVHNTPTSCSADGGAGIDNDSFTATDNEIIGNVVHDVGNPAAQCATIQGIYQSSLRGRILNNMSYHNAAWGIHLWHAANNVVVANNLVFQNGDGGIVVGAGDSPGGVIDDNTTVANNIVIYNGSRWGSGLAISEQGWTGPGNQYLNNLIWNNAQGITLQNGLHDLNTINADPRLANYQPDGNGDYHLQPSSPAIGAGTIQGMPMIDFDGAPPPADAKPRIGPYWFPAASLPWPWM